MNFLRVSLHFWVYFCFIYNHTEYIVGKHFWMSCVFLHFHAHAIRRWKVILLVKIKIVEGAVKWFYSGNLRIPTDLHFVFRLKNLAKMASKHVFFHLGHYLLTFYYYRLASIAEAVQIWHICHHFRCKRNHEKGKNDDATDSQCKLAQNISVISSTKIIKLCSFRVIIYDV